MRLMRSELRTAFLLVALCSVALAQGGDAPPAGGAPPDAPKEEPPVRMSDADRKAFEKLLDEFLSPGKKSRQEILERFEKFLAKGASGHSALEDVEGISEIAERLRGSNPKAGKTKGKVTEEEIKPDVHGFPGGIGTVKYFLHVPKDYTPQKAWPVIFCLPDNQTWGEGSSYLEEMWLKRSDRIAATHILVAPRPQTKGESWTSPKSLARAMITLRHICGEYESDKKSAGPSVDLRRIFLDADESGALVAARMPEIFAGAVLHKVEGAAPGQPNLREAGGLSGLAAYLVCETGNGKQAQFAQRVRAANGASVIEEAPAGSVLGGADAIAAWMEALPRATQPRKLDYTIHDSSFQRHYWLNVLEFDASAKPAPMISAEADRARNVLTIHPAGATRFELFLNDAIVDLNKELRIVVVDGERELEFFKGKATRSLAIALDELVASNHSWRIYPAKFIVDLPALRRAQAERDAAAAAAGGAGGGAGGGPAESGAKGGKAGAGPDPGSAGE